MRKLLIFCLNLLIIGTFSISAQKRKIRIEDEMVKNRLNLYAINENLIDYDITVTVKGTGFKQRNGKPRLTRIPATSKVKVLSLIIERGKKALYTYTIVSNDSLSKRVLKPEFIKIKINPNRPLVIYTTEKCDSCDIFINEINNGIYNYKYIDLEENLETKEQLKKYIPSIETLTTPIFSIGGKLYYNITSYNQLLEKLEE